MIGETITLRGQVESLAGSALFRVELKAGGKSRTLRSGATLTLAHNDSAVEVRTREATAILPVRTVEGDFGELLADPLADLVLDHAPGDHVATELSGNLIEEGDDVVVLGTVVEERPESGGSYRENGGNAVSVVTAEAIARGPEAAALLDEWQEDQRRRAEESKKKERASRAAAEKRAERSKREAEQESDVEELPLTPTWVFVALSALAAALFVWCVVGVGSVRFAAFTWALSVGMLSCALYVWRSRRWLPEFREVEQSAHGTGIRWGVMGWTAVGCTLCAITAFAAAALPFYGALAIGAIPLMHLAATLRRDHRAARTARQLLRTRLLPAQLPEKQFGAIEGQLEGEIGVVRKHDTKSQSYNVTRTDAQGASFQATETRATTHWQESWRCSKSALAVGDAQVTLEPKGALFAAPSDVSYPSEANPGLEHYLTHMPDPKMRERIRRADVSGRPRLTSRAESGYSLIAVGRLRREEAGLVLRATGPGSLLLFASPPGTSARATLRRRLRLHYAGVLAYLLLTGLSITLAFSVFR